MERKTNLITVNHENAYEYYDVAIKQYPNGTTEMKRYSRTLRRLKPGLELQKLESDIETLTKEKERLKSKETAEEEENEEHRKDNLHRSFTQLIDYIETNPIWLSFITLTFSENITDLDYANKEFNNYTRKVRRVFPDFKYIAVPEFQKRGAVHYHILTNIPIGSEQLPKRPPIKTFNEEKQKWYTLHYYDIPYWTNGNSSAFDIVNDTDENFMLGAYMGKYFYKNIDNRLFGRKKILKSQGLKKPKIIRYEKNDSKLQDLQEELSHSRLIRHKAVAPNEFAPGILITKYTK